MPLGLRSSAPTEDDLRLLAGTGGSGPDVRRFTVSVRNVSPGPLAVEEGDNGLLSATMRSRCSIARVMRLGHVIFFQSRMPASPMSAMCCSEVPSAAQTCPVVITSNCWIRSGTRCLPLGDEVGFICGHGPGGRIGEERLTNPFLKGI